MASLKEIRSRINSVTGTRKITSAMKMVSSAKLHKAQEQTAHFDPYCRRIKGMLESYIANGGDTEDMALLSNRMEVKRVAFVAFASNSSLCGAFNSNVRKKLGELLSVDYASLPHKDISLYLVGKKVYEAFSKRDAGYQIKGPFFDLAHKPDREVMDAICDELTQLFLSKEIDKVVVVYNKFKSTAVQIIKHETLFPVAEPTLREAKQRNIAYIVEPDARHFLSAIVPEIIHLQLYGALLNSYASEHGARATAMQTATDNAEELIEDLVLQYNKLRQDAITKELIDIIGGSEVQR